MHELPPDWRERMARLVSSADPADATLFAGGPVLSPLAQIGIYREQYHLRLVEAVQEDLLGLTKWVGESTVHEWVVGYLAKHPSRSWTLNRASLRFADWLADQPGVSVAQVEMARVDRAVQMGFEAGAGRPLSLADLASVPVLALAPHVTLLQQSTNVHAVRSALLADQSAPELVEAPLFLVLYRQNRGMRHWIMDEAPWRVLEGLAAGTALMESVQAVVDGGLVAPEALEGAVATWFRDFAEDGLLVRG